jgi:hypothetical protein
LARRKFQWWSGFTCSRVGYDCRIKRGVIIVE